MGTFRLDIRRNFFILWVLSIGSWLPTEVVEPPSLGCSGGAGWCALGFRGGQLGWTILQVPPGLDNSEIPWLRTGAPWEWSIRAPPALTQRWQSRLAPLPEVRRCAGTLPALPRMAAPRCDVIAPQWRGAAAAGRGQQRPADGGGPEPRGVTAKRGWRHHRPGDRDRHRAPHGGTGGSACARLRAHKHRLWLST